MNLPFPDTSQKRWRALGVKPCRRLLLAALALSPAWTAESVDLQIHGFVSQGYLASTNNNFNGRTTKGGTFEFNEFALNVVSRPVDRLTVGVQIFARDIGRYGNDEPQIDWAYGRYELPKKFSWLDCNVFAGRFKNGHGLYNDYRDLDVSRASVFLPASVYSPTFRELYMSTDGMGINFNLNAKKLGSFEIGAFVGTQNIDHQQGPIYDNFAQPFKSMGFGIDLSSLEVKRKDGASITWNTPLEGLKFKGSFIHADDFEATGKLDVPANARVMGFALSSIPGVIGSHGVTTEVPSYHHIIAGTEYQINDWTMAAECYTDYFKHRSSSTLFSALGPIGGAPTGTTDWRYFRTVGGYVSAEYNIPDSISSVNLGFLTDFSLYASVVAVNDKFNASRSNWHRGVNAAISYEPAEHWKIKFEFERNRGSWLLQGQDNPDGLSRYWNLYALKLTFDF